MTLVDAETGEVVTPLAVELSACEQVIEHGLSDAAHALRAIRDKRLYRGTWATFEDYCQQRWGFTRQHVNNVIAFTEMRDELMETNVSILPEREGSVRPLRTLPEPEQRAEAWNDAVELAGGGQPTAKQVEEAVERRRGNGQLVQQSLTNEWYTPARYIDAARLVLGGIDLDPASCAKANETVQAGRYYTEVDDGLTFGWHGRVWLNPPYGRIAGPFIEHLASEYRAGHVTAAVALVNAHCTDTQWFQPLWDHTLCFTDHRIDFEAGTAERSGSTHGSVFAYLGPDPDLFAKHFAEFGAVVRRWQ